MEQWGKSKGSSEGSLKNYVTSIYLYYYIPSIPLKPKLYMHLDSSKQTEIETRIRSETV